ncbi:uncharacterized protein LOC118310001 [Scophthalmus maximus]|uniref:uncharacterized protein LOC118310001 n=1 Tax=Scophthalmus maximus TaxID=52904 RepID=UPI001FA82944|nr:uncharacterized protein LOC118310001 [Scophthalmus maximus]
MDGWMDVMRLAVTQNKTHPKIKCVRGFVPPTPALFSSTPDPSDPPQHQQLTADELLYIRHAAGTNSRVDLSNARSCACVREKHCGVTRSADGIQHTLAFDPTCEFGAVVWRGVSHRRAEPGQPSGTAVESHQEIAEASTLRWPVPAQIRAVSLPHCTGNLRRPWAGEHPTCPRAAPSSRNAFTHPQSAILPWRNVDPFPPSSHSRNLLHVTCRAGGARIGWVSNWSLKGKRSFLRRAPCSVSHARPPGGQ